MNLEKEIQSRAKDLLEKGEVDVVIGFAKGTLLGVSTPFFAHTSDEAERLIIDSYCHQNLSIYVLQTERKGKIAVLARGCESRSILTLIKEQQIERQDVYIIGIPCEGIADKDSEGLHSSCQVCCYKNPVISDELIGQAVKEQEIDRFKEIATFSEKSAEERWSYFESQVSKCIRCYACRQACPSCYCPSCFVDQSQPAWFGKTTNLSDTSIFHIVRALHMAGRCVDCGACARACPMNVDLRRLTLKMEQEVKNRFEYTTGINLEESAPLAAFKTDDTEDYMREE